MYSGCRAGDACPYLHQETNAAASSVTRVEKESRPGHPTSIDNSETIAEVGLSTRAVHVSQPKASSSRPVLRTQLVVSKPVAPQQLADPRQFEISQIVRRFSPTVRQDDSVTILAFKLVPSDPDFPFELSGNSLDLTLSVPQEYPGKSQPSIRVSNPEMELGYQINVQKGFDELVKRYPAKTLLQLMNDLDKNLEGFLVSEKAPTVKLVANTDRRAKPLQHSPQLAASQQSVTSPTLVKLKAEPIYTIQQLQDAHLRRETDIRQIEARMGRQPLYSKSSDGYIFNIPLQVPKPGRLPTSLQSIRDTRLTVPQLYPLDPCKIRLREGSKEAELVERAFEKRSVEHPELTLMAHINNLAQNIHIMAREVVEVTSDQSSVSPSTTPNKTDSTISKEVSISAEPRIIDEDRPHVQVIARPPEWDMKATDSDGSDTSGSDTSDFDSDLDEEGGAELATGDQAQGIQHGILLTFPMLELYSIELLHILSLSLTVKCERCKETTDIMSIKPAVNSTEVSRIVESCKKCASALSVIYRGEPMHINSIRAGFLDLEGCTVADMLTSAFQPTCNACSTTLAKPSVMSVRGETTAANCRECHQRMTFKLPEVKFLRVSTAERSTSRPLPRKKAKENLGIVAGTELPRKGRCAHYAKSYRWFRFSCCGKVYACDRCHDASEQHPNEHANRMICGLCSREQNYRPEDCGICRSGLVGKKSGGFWEGGKGTRDKVRMSRKDPRKYKRRGGGAPVGGGTGKGK